MPPHSAKTAVARNRRRLPCSLLNVEGRNLAVYHDTIPLFVSADATIIRKLLCLLLSFSSAASIGFDSPAAAKPVPHASHAFRGPGIFLGAIPFGTIRK